MCTVSYIPKERDGTYILSSNRDEAPSRAATKIIVNDSGIQRVMYPQDPQSKGSWIAANDQGRTVCLLNGSFERHIPNPPYRMSRGLVVLDALLSSDAMDFFNTYDLDGVEPFTLIYVDRTKLHQFRWDANGLHLKELDSSQSYIWASSTLYTPAQIKEREQWFAKWKMEYDQPSQDQILDFHAYSGTGDAENDLVMNRENRVRTVSISSVFSNELEISMLHKDLISEQSQKNSFKFDQA